MKIASFNVNGLRARLPIVLDWLVKNSPDVLCVQETKVQDSEFPVDAFAESGYSIVFSGEKKYNGVAIFSRAEMSGVEKGFEDEPKDMSRLIKARMGEVTIVNTYVPQGYMTESEQYEYKLKWFGRLREYFESNFKPSGKIIWVGDMNVAPEERDVYDPAGLAGHVCFNEEVSSALSSVCEWGFADLFRQFEQGGGHYTFWDYRMRGSFSRNLGWRLDHIMVTKSLAAKCRRCYIDKDPRFAERPSDHTPIVAEFEI